MKRPAGVIFTSVLLGLNGLLQLGFAAMAAVVGVVTRPGTQYGPRTPGNPLLVLFVILTCFFLLVAGWSIATLVGLLRLRNWARYSVLIYAACVTALALFSIVGIVLAATVNRNAPTNGAPGHWMQIVFAFSALLYIVAAAIGVWCLVYFNMGKTKAFFQAEHGPDDALIANPYLAGSSYAPGILPANRKPGRLNNVPAPIIVIGCLLLVASLFCLLSGFLPFPAFLFGFIVVGHAVPIIYICIAIITALAGAGLLRLDNRARLVTLGFMAVGIANMVVLVTPWGMSRLQLYTVQVYAHSGIPQPPGAGANLFAAPLMYFSAAFGLAIYAAIAWILIHFQAAFAGALRKFDPPVG